MSLISYSTTRPNIFPDVVVYDARARESELNSLVHPYLDGNDGVQALFISRDNNVHDIMSWMKSYYGLQLYQWIICADPRGRVKTIEGEGTFTNDKIHALWYVSDPSRIVHPGYMEDTVMSKRRFPEAFVERINPSKTLLLQADYMDVFIYALVSQRKGDVYIYDDNQALLDQIHARMKNFSGVI